MGFDHVTDLYFYPHLKMIPYCLNNNRSVVFVFFVVSVANNTVIQVWVQGEKIEVQWKFDDGTPIPEYCRFSMSNGPTEVHMRAFGSTSFACGDNPNGSPFNYSCQYPSLSSIQN